MSAPTVYDVPGPGIRWRLPRQCDHWLAMTGISIARQIPICRDTERYRAGQAGNENRPRSSRLGRPHCGQIPNLSVRRVCSPGIYEDTRHSANFSVAIRGNICYYSGLRDFIFRNTSALQGAGKGAFYGSAGSHSQHCHHRPC